MGVVERGGKLYGVSLGALAGGAVGHQPAARDETAKGIDRWQAAGT